MSKRNDSRVDFCQTVQWNRYIHYERHYLYKTAIHNFMAPAELDELDRIAKAILPIPSLTPLGTVPESWLPAEVESVIHSVLPFNVSPLFNPWYLSAEGWQQFQRLWQAMPEPEQIDPFPCHMPKDDRVLIVSFLADLPYLLTVARALNAAGIGQPVQLPFENKASVSIFERV